MDYTININQGNEYFGTTEKTLTANEVVKTVSNREFAREINRLNPLIPQQVAEDVLENFCFAAAAHMAEGRAIHLKSRDYIKDKIDVALRIYPDIHLKAGSLSLSEAQELDPTITDFTKENAPGIVQKAGGVTYRVKVEAEVKFTEMLKEQKPELNMVGVVVKDPVTRTADTSTGTVDTSTNAEPEGDDGLGG